MCLQGKVRAMGVCEKFLFTQGHIQDDGSDLSHKVRAEEHREVAKGTGQKRQQNEAGLPLNATTPEERWTTKKFGKVLDRIRQKYWGLSMMTQIGRLLAEQGLERLNEDQTARIEAAVRQGQWHDSEQAIRKAIIDRQWEWERKDDKEHGKN